MNTTLDTQTIFVRRGTGETYHARCGKLKASSVCGPHTAANNLATKLFGHSHFECVPMAHGGNAVFLAREKETAS